MISRSLVVGLLVAGCITAAGGGAYLAVRQNAATSAVAAEPVGAPLAAPAPEKPVAETEAVVTPPAPAAPSAPAPAAIEKVEKEVPAPPSRRSTSESRTARSEVPRTSPSRPPSQQPSRAPQAVPGDQPPPERPVQGRDPVPGSPTTQVAPTQPDPLPVEPPPPPRPQFVEVVVPASAVVGLQVETSVSSETARVEDRVEARVTRDVFADGRVAIPAGTKVIGDVVVVERGGKMKDKARLGVRFHTLVMADGDNVTLRTDGIFREGASPGAESARKIGGAAIGGAILGAILGGAKGAAIGSATGAAGGGAVVMAGDRNPATLPAGTIVTVRLNSPVSVDVEKEQ
jgi:hypothetical protein